MKNLVIFCMALLLLISCNRHVSKNKSRTDSTWTHSVASTDSTKTVKEFTFEKTESASGTLSGTMRLPFFIQYMKDQEQYRLQNKKDSIIMRDTMESEGMIITSALIQDKHGLKIKHNAKAKKTSSTEKRTEKTTEQKDVSITEEKKSQAKSEVAVVDKKTTQNDWLLIFLILCGTVLAGYFLNKVANKYSA